MTNILDGLTLAITGPDKNWKCSLPHEQEEFSPKDEEVEPDHNDDAYLDEDTDVSPHDTFNSSKKLGAALNALGDKIAEYKSTRVRIKDDDCNERKVTVAAHHLIPGNAALKPSPLMDYISKSKGKIAENIGYNVNAAENGVWLPGWYAIKGWGKMQTTEKGRLFRARYVLAINKALSRQFHDTHTEYSEFVLGCLNKIYKKMKRTGMYFCEDCKKANETDGMLPPPYALVNRLNGVSRRLKKYLLGTRTKWKKPIHTSDTWIDTELAGKVPVE